MSVPDSTTHPAPPPPSEGVDSWCNADGDSLLRAFAERRSEPAFAELVRRHLHLVYGAALRCCGNDRALAEEVSQLVFVDFARKAGSLIGTVSLGGWLHRHTTFVASSAVRSEIRRRRREATAMELRELEGSEAADWTRIAPFLETALLELPDADREAIVERYLEGHPFARIGQQLGVSADAARMRVDRAVEKLRLGLVKRGVTSTAAALAVVLGQHGLAAAPSGLASSIVTAATAASVAGAAALGGAAGGTLLTTGQVGSAAGGVGAAGLSTTGTGILGIMSTSKLALGLAGLMAAGSLGVVIRARSDRRDLAAQVASLRVDLEAARHAAENARPGLSRDATQLEEAKREHEQLLALRGEVGALRESAKELARLRDEKQRSASAGAGRKSAVDEDEPTDLKEAMKRAEEETSRAVGIVRMNFTRAWAMAFFQFSQANGDRMPATFAEAESFLPPEQRGEISVFDPNRFEIVYRGRIGEVKDPAKTILIREKEAWESPLSSVRETGRVLKTYAFVDGHSEIHAARPEEIEAWERERMVTNPGSAGGEAAGAGRR